MRSKISERESEVRQGQREYTGVDSNHLVDKDDALKYSNVTSNMQENRVEKRRDIAQRTHRSVYVELSDPVVLT